MPPVTEQPSRVVESPLNEPPTSRDTAVERLFSALSHVVDTVEWHLVLWDGRSTGATYHPRFTLTLHSKEALNLLISAMPEKGFGRAYVSGELDVDPLRPFLETLESARTWRFVAAWPRVVAAAISLGARPDLTAVSAVEAHLHGRRHSRERDAEAIRHHYDLPAEFYSLWLDPSLTYSCAYFTTPHEDLATAQFAKNDLVCRKLRLMKGETLLDIGCGWGALVLHAAEHYGVHATGITLSPRQAQLARDRVHERGLDDQVDIRLADYRDDLGLRYDAVASVGMVEHVGRRKMDDFCKVLRRSVVPGGRVLLHGITTEPSLFNAQRGSFLDAFVFPDGELQELGSMISHVQSNGLEVHDVENLKEHYALTLERWTAGLEARWSEAVEIVGDARARTWKLYMAGAEIGFRRGSLGVNQILAVRPDARAASRLPLTRDDWYRDKGAQNL